MVSLRSDSPITRIVCKICHSGLPWYLDRIHFSCIEYSGEAMKAEAQDVALAILSRVKERGGFVNKTKLLKLLYLADIEHFRKFGSTVTGFDWIFYFYGPWASEYDSLLEELERRDAIALETWASGDHEGASIRLRESRDLDSVIQNADEFFRIRHQIDAWAERSLPELLNYVYFETEPMSDAVSGETLQFGKITKEAPKLYRRAKSQAHPEALRRLKEKMQSLQRAAEERRQATLRDFRHPRFDDVYAAAMGELDSEENRRA